MIRRISIFISFIVIHNCLMAQLGSTRNMATQLNAGGMKSRHIIQDFNKDGFVDTLSYFDYEWDSDQMRFIDGKTQKSEDIYFNYYYKSSFISYISIPDILLKPSYKSALDSVKSKMLYWKEVEEFTSPMDWIYRAYSNSEYDTSNLYFDIKINAKLRWANKKPTFPKVSYTIVNRDTISILYPSLDGINEDTLNRKNYINIYYGHNHRTYTKKGFVYDFILIDSNKLYSIYKTAHGLVLKRRGYYSWIFHTNNSLTGGPEKLRWASISKVKTKGDLLIFKLKCFPGIHSFYYINLRNGAIGRLKLDSNFYNSENQRIEFSIKENELLFTCNKWEGEEKKYKGFYIPFLLKNLNNK